jgi:hypothetical protein
MGIRGIGKVPTYERSKESVAANFASAVFLV